ncbi:MAG: hypothetical protein WKG32_19820 [Gemmatimonadaceae bacterium]
MRRTPRIVRRCALAITLLLAAGSVAVACRDDGSGPDTRAGRRILFIGNSLTFVNAAPLIVEALADSAGSGRLAVSSVAFPDYGLEEHWLEGTAQDSIAKGGWSVVVLQQGPSALPESRVLLRDYANRFAAEIRRAGGRPALYAPWPMESRQFDFAASAESYALAAADVGGMLFPVSQAWVAAWRRDAALQLYEVDGLHASARGSYLAAGRRAVMRAMG